MFQQLFQLLKKCDSVSLSIAPAGEGEMTVSVIPNVSGKDIEEALKMRLTLTATPEEFDTGFIAALTSFTEKRESLAEQVEVTNTLLEAAKKESEKKATKTVSKPVSKAAPKSTTVDQDAEDDGEDDQDLEPEANLTTTQPEVAETAPAENLWG